MIRTLFAAVDLGSTVIFAGCNAAPEAAAPAATEAAASVYLMNADGCLEGINSYDEINIIALTKLKRSVG